MYDVIKLQSIFTSILGESRQFANNEYYFHCPFCNHYKPKLAVNLAKGKWHCWKCNASGNRLISLARRLNVSKEQIQELRNLLIDEIPYIQEDKSDAVFALPQEYLPLWNPIANLKYRHAISYLRKRNVTAYDILKYQIGYCETGRYADRIIIPSYDADNKLNYFIARAFFEMQPYQNPPISKNVVGFENMINWKYPVTLVEGVFDALAVKRNAIPLFGKTLMTRLKNTLMDKKPPQVNIALDADALQNSVSIARELIDAGLKVYFVNLDGKDPSSVGFEKYRELERLAEEVTFSKLLELKMKD